MNVTEVRKQIKILKETIQDYNEGSFTQGFLLALAIVDGYLANVEYTNQIEEELEK